MPFDPALPLANTPATSALMRDQFNGLKELIDTLSTQVGSLQAELASIPPGVAQILDAHADLPGALWIEFAANRALSYIYWRRGPSDPDFVVHAVPGPTHEETGLESGTHTVKVAGLNAGGVGPESATMEIVVI